MKSSQVLQDKVVRTITITLIHDGDLHRDLVLGGLVSFIEIEATLSALTQIYQIQRRSQSRIRSSHNQDLEGWLFVDTGHDGDLASL